MTVDVLLHASDTAHVESVAGVLVGVLLFALVLLALRTLSADGPTGGRRTE